MHSYQRHQAASGRIKAHADGVIVMKNDRLLYRRRVHTNSMAIAVASPPPIHSAATPLFAPRVVNALRRVTTIRAPLAPIGWPSAQAPPWILIFSWETPSSRMTAIGTTANASFISNRSTSSVFQPAFASTLEMAPTGAVVNHSGSCEWVAWATMRASGVTPRVFASSAESSTSAAAPSEMLDELAAVIVPFSLRNAARRVG